MTTVELIYSRFDVVETTSDKLNVTFEEKVNKYLDIILKMTNDLNDISNLIGELVDLLYENIDKIPLEDNINISSRLASLNKKLTLFYIGIRKSPLYSKGLKTPVNELHYELLNLKEIYNDLIIYNINTESQDRFKTLIEEIKTL